MYVHVFSHYADKNNPLIAAGIVAGISPIVVIAITVAILLVVC